MMWPCCRCCFLGVGKVGQGSGRGGGQEGSGQEPGTQTSPCSPAVPDLRLPWPQLEGSGRTGPRGPCPPSPGRRLAAVGRGRFQGKSLQGEPLAASGRSLPPWVVSRGIPEARPGQSRWGQKGRAAGRAPTVQGQPGAPQAAGRSGAGWAMLGAERGRRNSPPGRSPGAFWRRSGPAPGSPWTRRHSPGSSRPGPRPLCRGGNRVHVSTPRPPGLPTSPARPSPQPPGGQAQRRQEWKRQRKWRGVAPQVARGGPACKDRCWCPGHWGCRVPGWPLSPPSGQRGSHP